MNIDLDRLNKAKEISGWMLDSELKWLMETSSNYKSIIEIGSYEGKSTKALSGKNIEKIIVIDSWMHELNTKIQKWEENQVKAELIYNNFCKNLKYEIESGILEIFKMNSDEAYKILKQRNILVDMIFIDGEHYSPFIDNDIKNYITLIKSGGIICGHDYNNNVFKDINKALETNLPEYKLGPGFIWYYKIP